MPRKSMLKPTKSQVTDRLAHFEQGVNDLVKELAAGSISLEAVFPQLQSLVASAPSLEPVAKTVDPDGPDHGEADPDYPPHAQHFEANEAAP